MLFLCDPSGKIDCDVGRSGRTVLLDGTIYYGHLNSVLSHCLADPFLARLHSVNAESGFYIDFELID